ncbi:MAG TPA: DinB family protein [Methylomirabilota bacterium]|nr:DinB family protein [Methylomirabilota bacterium]
MDQLQRAWDGEPFHGPAVRTLLQGVGAPAAFARPLAGAHSIAEIARHIGTWEDIVRRRLGGEVIDTVPDDQDWPAVGEATASGWDATRRWLDEVHARLEGAVAALPEGRLGEAVPARDYDVEYMLNGILQHTLYHAGQIALLKAADGR